jgi:signal transduction histidine kinase
MGGHEARRRRAPAGEKRRRRLGGGTEAERRTAQQEAEVSAALAQVGRALISSVDRPALLERLCQVTTDVLHCDCSHTVLLNPRTELYVAAAGHGYPAEQWEWLRLLETPREMTAAHLAPLEHDDVLQLLVPEASADPLTELSRQLGFTAVLCMALRRDGSLIGYHVACHRQRRVPFTAQQERVGRGIAQLATLALENARLVEELAHASRLKSEFVATMSHELRTPLNAIIGYTDLMLDGVFGPLNAEQAETERRVADRARDLLDLINDTLDLSRLDAGHVALDLREAPLVEILAELRAETREALEKPGVQTLWTVEPGLPPLRTDPLKLKVVLKNLLLNALKFTDRGHVEVAARSQDGGVQLSVTDTGVGIASDALPIIFEPFRQADSSNTRRYGGVGLGLYIVRRLLGLLGGTIDVESVLGRGSTFRIRLPTEGPAPAEERTPPGK